jgi:hypothetical protein
MEEDRVMKPFMKLCAMFVLVAMLSGCMSLTQSEKNAVYELKSYGVNTCSVKAKDPSTAAWLCLLPFAGYWYLANGSDENQLWAMMPFSWVWSIPGAYSDAVVLNKKELVRYYQYKPAGQEELKALREKYRTVELGLSEIDSNDGRIRAS